MNIGFKTRLPEEFWALKRGEVSEIHLRRYNERTKQKVVDQWAWFCRMHKTANPELIWTFEVVVGITGVTIRRRGKAAGQGA